jgi:hypothetical protein
MAEGDWKDPNISGDDVDLRSFYRDPPAMPPPPPSSNAPVNINEFLLPPERVPAPEPVHEVAHQFYSAPAVPPADVADGAKAQAHAPALAHLQAEQAALRAEAPPEIPLPEIPLADGAAVPEAAGAEVAGDGTAAPTEAIEQGPGEAPEEIYEQVYPPEKPKLTANPLVRYAIIGGLAGVVFGAIAIGLSFMFAKPDGPYDLGNMFSNPVGLKGHLYTKWEDDKLNYRVSFEPNDPDFHKGFGVAVSTPQRPLAVGIHLKDAMGFALCSKEILLPYDAAAGAAAVAVKGAPPQPTFDPALAAAQERQREQGKDLFQSQNGSDGLPASISAQGQFPCAEADYRKVVAWGFTPDFPSLQEQSDLVKQVDKAKEPAEPAHKHQAVRPAEKGLVFYIEGDDAIAGYDPASGVFETTASATFVVDKDSAQIVLAGQQFPIRIHYRCDQSANCTLTRSGAAPIHARLRR